MFVFMKIGDFALRTKTKLGSWYWVYNLHHGYKTIDQGWENKLQFSNLLGQSLRLECIEHYGTMNWIPIGPFYIFFHNKILIFNWVPGLSDYRLFPPLFWTFWPHEHLVPKLCRAPQLHASWHWSSVKGLPCARWHIEQQPWPLL